MILAILVILAVLAVLAILTNLAALVLAVLAALLERGKRLVALALLHQLLQVAGGRTHAGIRAIRHFILIG